MLNRSRIPPAQDGADDGSCQVVAVDAQRVQRARAALLSDPVAEDVTELFHVLAHPTRVGILRALDRETLCVCELADLLGLSDSAVSHQLRAMRRLRLVECRMDGKLAFYSIREPLLVTLLDQVIAHVGGTE